MNRLEKITLLSDSLKLEALLEFDENNHPSPAGFKEIAIICHPHPCHGGTMNNKVVHSLIKACIAKNMATLRFNFRGVGLSQGEFGNFKAELTDLKTAIDFIKTQFNPQSIRLGGFSFGSFIALDTYCQLNQSGSSVAYTKPLIIAPPIGVEGYQFENLNPKEALIVQGVKDDIVNESKVREWVFNRKENIDYLSLSDCGHFFHKKTVVLKNSLIALI